LNTAGTALKTLFTGAYFTVHTGTPDSAGSNELAAGGYTRQAATWGTVGSNGDFSATGTPAATFTGPANQTVAAIGLRSASSGGTWYGYHVPTGDLAFNASGVLNLTSYLVDLSALA
jgi:hypothetical protein